jgi:hypothetical protein
MPSTDRKLELTAKASMAQPVSQPAVCSNGLKGVFTLKSASALSGDTRKCRLFEFSALVATDCMWFVTFGVCPSVRGGNGMCT